MRWKIIEGWPDYVISDRGIVAQSRRMVIGSRKGRAAGVIPQMKASQRGYMQVQLIDEKRRLFFYVHQLVAKAFIPNPNNYPKVNHKDNDPTNNHFTNLEWCTQLMNVHHAIKLGRHPSCFKLQNS